MDNETNFLTAGSAEPPDTALATYWEPPVMRVGPYDARAGWLTRPNQPVPLDGHEPPDWDELEKPTPKIYRRIARNEKTGEILYRYVPTIFVYKRLNKVFHYQWGTELVTEEWGEPDIRLDTRNNKTYQVVPYTCIIQLVAPGMFRPIIGVGSSFLYGNNPQESKAKTRNAALTAALKAAAKQLGIGRDVEEDDPEVAREINSKQTNIQMIYDKLVERGAGEAAKAAIRRVEPEALLDSGVLRVNAISTEHLDETLRELTVLVAKPVKVTE